MNKEIQQTEMMAKSHSLGFKDLGNGHVQISGHGVLVNYWPNSKTRTAHIIGGESVKHCSPFDAVKLCMIQGKTVSGVKLKPGKKPSKRGPDFDLKPITANPAGIMNFYKGKTPPWEFPSTILCESDNLRIKALRLQDEAILMEADQS